MSSVKYILGLCAVIIIVGTGYYLGVKTPGPQGTQAPQTQTPVSSQEKNDDVKSAGQKLEPVPAKENAPAETKFEVPPEPEIQRKLSGLSPEIKKMLEKNKMMDHYKKLAPNFGEDETGKNLLLVSTFLGSLGNVSSPEAKLVEEKIRQLEEESAETMLSIGIAFKRMGHEFPNEKQYFLQLVEKLDVSLEEKTELLSAEAKRAYGPSELEGQARFDAPRALIALANVYQGKEKYFHPIVRDIVEAHKENPQMQKLLLQEYGRFYGARSKELSREMGLSRK